MSLQNRAAQFAPFAALTGYDGQINSAQHHRQNKVILTEYEIQNINRTLQQLQRLNTVHLSYFVEDYGTDGSGGMAEGEYFEITGEVLSVSATNQTLRLLSIPAKDELDIRFEDILFITKTDNEIEKTL